MTKTKKMTNLGLILMLVGGIIALVGGFIYNKYSGKARSESHSEIIQTQGELGNKIDSSTADIIKSIEKKHPSLNKEKKWIHKKRNLKIKSLTTPQTREFKLMKIMEL